MSDPILPASVASRHYPDNSATSLPAPVTQSSKPSVPSGTSLSIADSGATAPLGDETDAPYEYPTTHPPKFPLGTYLSYVKRVAANSPMLQPVFRPCLNPDKVDVIVLDIREDWTCLKPYIFGDSESINDYFGPAPPEPRGKKLGYSSLRTFLEQPKPTDVFVRLFLVEDLSPAMIEALGSSLDLDPNFFAEQLVGTKYTLEGHEDPTEIREALPTMPFLLNSKKFFSSTWKRSALQDSEPPESYKTSSRNFGGSKGKPIIGGGHQYNNILRPFDAIGEHIITEQSQTVVAAEEKMTFLRKDDGHGWTGVFLFDPVRLRPGSPEKVLYNHNYRNLQPTPSYLEFDGSNYRPEYTNNPYTRNQIVKFITMINEIKGRNGSVDFDNLELKSSSSFLNLPFHFMVNDWISVLREMDKFLDGVDTFMSDNNMLQKKLVTWRIILGSWRKNLVDDSEKIRVTLGVIEKYELDKFERAFKDILNHIESLRDRTERTFSALMSSMAIVESQRAITQAESISRLTELAFLFIPLGFATSIFSMQLPGMVENYRPYQWVIVSICLLIGSYGFRIAVRSRASGYALERIPEKVREERNILLGAHIPTFDYLVWLTQKLWKAVILSVISVISWVLIWTIGHSRSVQVATTVVVTILFSAGLVIIFYWPYWKKKKAMQQKDIENWMQQKDNKRKRREATGRGYAVT